MASDLNTMLEFIQAFRTANPPMSADLAAILLIIAANPGITQVDLGRRVGLESSSVSRLTSVTLMQGYKFVRLEEGEDRRIKNTYLTANGERFIAGLKEILNRRTTK